MLKKVYYLLIPYKFHATYTYMLNIISCLKKSNGKGTFFLAYKYFLWSFPKKFFDEVFTKFS